MKTIKILNTLRILLVIGLVNSSCSEGGDDDVTTENLTIDTTEMTFGYGGGSKNVNIKTSANIAWGVRTDADWISLSQTSGLGTKEVTIAVAANTTDNERNAMVTVFASDQSTDIQITQNAIVATVPPDASGMSDHTSVALTDEMGIGWNLGNSLEAVGGETAWGNPRTDKELIDAVSDAGFKTVRIPVAWSNYITEGDDNYIISEEGLTRVEEVVNYVLDNDMYAVMNIHWDGGWMQPTYADQDYVNDILAKMWKQIAVHFRDYDHHLLFAGTNEVMVEGDYGTPTEEYYTVQNSFNQTFINTVRQTGGKNAYRYLIVQGFNTNIDHTVNFVDIPDDPAENRMLMEVHYYDPYEFTLDVSNDNIWQWGAIANNTDATASWGGEDWLETQFQKMHDNFVSKGIGVVLGEYGASYRENIPGAETYRQYYYKMTTKAALEHDMVPIIWDNGSLENHQMGLFERSTGNEHFPDLIDAITEN